MTCFHPLSGYRAQDGTLTFNPLKSRVEGYSLCVPCGQCLGCRIARTREWAMRCSHEAKMHSQNSFVTLTYDDKHLPKDGSVHLRVLQLFMKRLRKSLPQKIRFFGCGEYGDQFSRPHYHLLLFNVHFGDRKKFSVQNKNILYTSEKLQKLWKYGFTTVANVNYQTAAYVARYSLKKIGGDAAAAHYRGRQPEFATMSGGLGLSWLKKFKDDCYPSDFLIVDGKKHPVPKYYDQKLKAWDQAELVRIKRVRKANANKHRSDQTPERLAVREEVLEHRIKRLKRVLGDYK